MSLDEIIAHRSAHLTDYQNARLAQRYRKLVDQVREAATSGRLRRGAARAVAINYAKLLAYKDEYEVARLFTDGKFEKQLREQFEGDYKISFNLAPPILNARRRCAGPAEEARLRPRHDEGVPAAGETAGPARHAARHFRLQRRPQARARSDRRLREGRRDRARRCCRRPMPRSRSNCCRCPTASAATARSRRRRCRTPKRATRSSPPTSPTRRRRQGRWRRSRGSTFLSSRRRPGLITRDPSFAKAGSSALGRPQTRVTICGCHRPRRRAIQYAAAHRFNHQSLEYWVARSSRATTGRLCRAPVLGTSSPPSHPTEYFRACQGSANRPENWLTRTSRSASGDLS